VNFGNSQFLKFYTNLASLKMCGFNLFYQNLLSLFDILNTFYNNI